MGTFLSGAEPPAAAKAMLLAREAATAAESQDNAAYLAKMEQAVALRPDFPRLLLNLAAAQVANDRLDEALATLERLAALGLSAEIEKAREFERLRERTEFKDIVKKFAANLHSKGAGETAFALRGITGLIEGIAWRAKTDEFYFADVNGRAVWVRNKSGVLRRLTPEGDDLLGVFALAIDEASGALWAATTAVPAMQGFTPEQEGTAALVELDLATGAVRRSLSLERKPGDQQAHVLGDLALAPDGSIFVPDSGAPVLWHLPPGGQSLEPFAESAEFMFLQGVVVHPASGALILSDRTNGLLRVDLTSRDVRRIESPDGATLVGLDGLVLTPTGDVLAIQNALHPARVLRLALDAAAENVTAVAVLESGHLTLIAPSLGCLGSGGHFFYIGNTGWARFESTEGRPTAPRSVAVFRTKLEPVRR